MFGLRDLQLKIAATGTGVAEVGWLLQAEQALFIWASPKPLRKMSCPVTHAKSVNVCPAVIDHEARLFEVSCPFDLHLRMRLDENGNAKLSDVDGDMATVSPKLLSQLTVIDSPKAWRRVDRPVIQILTPYTFLADEPVYMTQLSPLAFYPEHPWPGLVIGGRVPINIWPRTLTWAFEWCDIGRDLILKRGDPWFYVLFETRNVTRRVRLVEAQLTPELSRYLAGVKNVVHFTNKTFSLFNTAKERRPPKLIKKARS